MFDCNGPSDLHPVTPQLLLMPIERLPDNRLPYGDATFAEGLVSRLADVILAAQIDLLLSLEASDL